MELWTIGHSNRTWEDFLALLHAFQIEALVDVRSFPCSRRYPQFSKTHFERALFAQAQISYQHLPELGGRRRPKPNSVNTLWRSKQFRAYADYMMTPPFLEGIRKLEDIARAHRTAIMCAEALWWRCHRGLISDYLKAQGLLVHHIISRSKAQLHPFTSAARFINGVLSYRGQLSLELAA